MKIGGLQKFSLLDYPNKISAIIFTQGCNFRCQFCYNPMLVWPTSMDEGSRLKYETWLNNQESKPSYDEDQIGHTLFLEDDLFDFLQKRLHKLDAVVITGGEPTLHSDLPEFLNKIKKMGYHIKLDTNGTNPEMLKKLLAQDLVDYFAMDIKAPAVKYEKITGVKVNLDNIKKSVKIIKESGKPYEFRTTVVPGLHEMGDIAGLGELINGAELWYLQYFKSDTELVNAGLEGKKAFTGIELEKMRKEGEGWVKRCLIR